MKNNFKNLILFIVLLLSVSNAFAQTTAFTYQGKLTDTGVAANGPYDLTFRLFSLASGGVPVGGKERRIRKSTAFPLGDGQSPKRNYEQ